MSKLVLHRPQLAGLAIVVAITGACGHQSTAAQGVTAYCAALREGRYTQIWEESHPGWRKAVPKQEWIEYYCVQDKQLGRVRDCRTIELTSAFSSVMPVVHADIEIVRDKGSSRENLMFFIHSGVATLSSVVRERQASRLPESL